MSVLSFMWDLVMIFLVIAYLMVLFRIIADIFISHDLSGGMKAVWIVALIFIPFITALVYLIARGDKMVGHDAARAQHMQEAQASYIRNVAADAPAAQTPASQIQAGHELLKSGAINEDQFEALKAKVLTT